MSEIGRMPIPPLNRERFEIQLRSSRRREMNKFYRRGTDDRRLGQARRRLPSHRWATSREAERFGRPHDAEGGIQKGKKNGRESF